MSGNFDKCLTEVLSHEGGFVNHPADPGGMTNLGVTKAVYEAWVGHPVNESVMRRLTVAHVRALYKKKYWDVVSGDSIPLGLGLCVFDFAVNAGPTRAARYLQLMVGTTRDGVIGPTTLRKVSEYVQEHGLHAAIEKYQSMRDSYYRKLKTFPTFGRGWLRRVASVTVAAKRMAR